MVADEVARRFGATWREKGQAAETYLSARDLVLLKPLSFMNDSGTPLQRVAAWYKIPPERILVVSDDLDLPFGRLRMRASGGSGGHNGLRSIISYFGEEFPRLRIGIGRSGFDAVDHVLSPFDEAEWAQLPQIVAAAGDGVERWLTGGIVAAMQQVNAWQVPQAPA
jgi:PTH1 family peptidyl-tRNA hydrolase